MRPARMMVSHFADGRNQHGGLRQFQIMMPVSQVRGAVSTLAELHRARAIRRATLCRFVISLVAVAILAASGARAQSQATTTGKPFFARGLRHLVRETCRRRPSHSAALRRCNRNLRKDISIWAWSCCGKETHWVPVRQFETALKLKPGLRGANLFLGITLYGSNQFGAAKLAFERELAGDPKQAAAMEWLGRTEIALNEPSNAADILDKALALDPHNVDALYFCGRAHMLASKEAYDKMYSADPNSWRVHEVLAQSYSDSDHYQQAITEYLAAIQLAPHEPELHEWLGDEYLATSKTS